jgi:hypothetical protein
LQYVIKRSLDVGDIDALQFDFVAIGSILEVVTVFAGEIPLIVEPVFNDVEF